MDKFFCRRFSACLLALIMTVSLLPTAAAQTVLTKEVESGGRIEFSRTDFRDLFEAKVPEDSLYYLEFTSFSQLDDYGSLYAYDHQDKLQKLDEALLENAWFYYSAGDVPDNCDYALSGLTFASHSTAPAGTLTLEYILKGDDGQTISGTLTIEIESAPTAVSTDTIADIRYYTTYNTALQLKAGDFSAFFRKHFPNDSLQSVRLDSVPQNGTLYYNYYNASSYGAARTALTADNCGSQLFYTNPTDASQYALTELTYVPYSTNYCDVISFTASGTEGHTIQGTIVIGVTLSAMPEVYGVTPKNTAVAIPPSAIYSAVSSATGAKLAGIQLLELPPASAGTVTAVSGTVSTSASTSTLYRYGNGSSQMSRLRFTPAGNYTGSVEIPYAAINDDGTPIASGKFCLGVVNSVKRFSDVSSSSWCYKYVTELSDASIINGYDDGTFRPDITITYGAALKLIMLAAGYAEQAPVGSHVFSGYLARAQADGIITRSNVDLSGPINRLQVAQLAAGAMRLDLSNLSSVKPFTDTSDIYVQALNAAGIVEGYFSNGTSTYKPGNTLTRGQVSAIVWRMMNYNR